MLRLSGISYVNNVLHPCHSKFKVRIGGTLYGGEQVYRMIEAQQCGMEGMKEELANVRFQRKPVLMEAEHPFPTYCLPEVPRQWVESRELVRQTIFSTASDQIPGYRDALSKTDTFLFLSEPGFSSDHWTTGESAETLRDPYRGHNALGSALRLSALPYPRLNLDLYQWLTNELCGGGFSGAPYGFLILGDSSLKYLESIESSCLLIKPDMRLGSVNFWLGYVDQSKFENVIIQCSMLDIGCPRRQIIRYFKQIASVFPKRSIYISAPMPAARCPDVSACRFTRQVKALCRFYGFVFIETKDRATTLRQSGFPIDSSRARALVTLWENAIPELRRYQQVFSQEPYQQPFRCGHTSRLMLWGSYKREGSIQSPKSRLILGKETTDEEVKRPRTTKTDETVSMDGCLTA